MNKKFRRTLAGLTAFLMAFSAAAIPQIADNIGVSVVASAENAEGQAEATVNGIKYTLNGDTASVASQDTSLSGAITIPEKITVEDIEYNVTAIDDVAFLRCQNITSISLPDSITNIGVEAFYNCTGLTSISIPKSVTSIGSNVFAMCTSLTEISVDSENTAYSSENGVLFNKDMTTLLVYPRGKTETEYVIPGSVTAIGESAFEKCSKLTSITFPANLASIGKKAFMFCTGFTSISIPTGVTTIGDEAFINCRELTSISIPETVTAIGECVFLLCGRLESLTVDNNNPNYSSDNGVLFDKNKTTLLFYPTAKSDTTYYLPDSVTSITEEALSYAVFVNIEVGEQNTAYSSKDGVLFDKAGTTLIYYPRGRSNESYIIPDGTISIGDGAFYSRDNLTSIIIPDSVISIGDTAFYGCNSLTSLTIPNKVTSIGDSVFRYCSSLTSITIPNSVTTLGHAAFMNNEGLTSLTLPSRFKDTISFYGVGEGVSITYTGEHALNIVADNGTVEVTNYREQEVTSVQAGDTYDINVTPDNGYKIKSVKVGDETLTATAEGKYSYTVPVDLAEGTTVTVTAEIVEDESVPKRLITIKTPDVTVKNGDKVIKSGDKVPDGTTLNFTYSGKPVAIAPELRVIFPSSDPMSEHEISGPLDNSIGIDIEIDGDVEVLLSYATKVAVEEARTEYWENETEFDKSQGIFAIYFDDDSKQWCQLNNNSSVQITGFVPGQIGEQTITFKEGTRVATLKINVKKIEIESITVSGAKTQYKTGEALDVSGAKLLVKYNNSDTPVEVPITGEMVEGFSSATANNNLELTIPYTDNDGRSGTGKYSVVVLNADEAVTGISIKTSPTKTDYVVGDLLDLAGGVITVNYTKGVESLSKDIPIEASMVSVSAFVESDIGEKKITVNYGGNEAEFTVNVSALAVKDAELTAPTKLDYKVDESLDLTGGKLTLTHNNGKIENIPLTDSRVSVTGFSSSTAGRKTVTVKFGDITKTFTVTVTANSSSGNNPGTGGGTGGSGSSSGRGSSSGGSSGGSSSTPKNPTVDGKTTTWDDIASDITKLTEGKTETIEINGATSVPVDVVKAIATSNAEVTLKVDSVFSWTIDGSDIDEKDAKAADFSITKTKITADNTPRGMEGTSFSVKGTNVKSELNINFKKEHAEEFANLYKMVDGKLVFVDNVKVDKNGAAIGLEVSDKGEYVVMLGKYSDRSGDMDNDGIMNAKDSLAVLKDFLDIESGTNPIVADVNHDGIINAKDALQILLEYINLG